jgi:hypothetical protein
MKKSSSWRFVSARFLCRVWAGVFLVVMFLGFVRPANAQCDLQIASAGPCLADGTYGTPSVGEDYFLKVVVNVVGTPTNAFRIKFTLANVTFYTGYISLGPGIGYGWYYDWRLYLDDSIPWSITLDPDGVSGDTNLANNTISGTFTPVPPVSTVELYDPRTLTGSETSILDYQPGSGSINNLWVDFGQPVSHGAQNVVKLAAPTNANSILTAPCGVPVFEVARTNATPATLQDVENFTVQASRICVNPGILREVTWAEMAGLSSNWTEWLAPDQICESIDPAITNFVQASLPANYQATMTPYDTARQLHKAVMKALSYQYPPDHADAVSVLADRHGDCGGYSALLTAALRQVGIPARRISGFWVGDSWSGDSQWHIRVEFHLPGTEWLVADPTLGNGFDPTGTYAYEFGYVPDADSFFAVDVGDNHELPYYDFPTLQVPNIVWYGTATLNSVVQQFYLQPVGILNVSNIVGGDFQFALTNAPSDGSIVIESSTNLFDWSPVVTNAASADTNSFSFSLPMTGRARQFFRANQVP